MGNLAKIVPLLAAIWRRLPPWLRGAVTWRINGKVIVGVSGVLLDDRNRALLLRHRFHSPNVWGMPGGWLSPGETIFDCWRREVREELALEVAVEGIIFHRAMPRTLEFYLVGQIIGGQLAVDPVEILEPRFFSAEELGGESFRMEPFQRQLIGQLLRSKEKTGPQNALCEGDAAVERGIARGSQWEGEEILGRLFQSSPGQEDSGNAAGEGKRS